MFVSAVREGMSLSSNDIILFLLDGIKVRKGKVEYEGYDFGCR